MAYDLSRLNVLVVEDNSYIRSLISMALRAVGIGNLKAAAHGGEAIEILRLMKHDPNKAGLMTVDVIVSNWEMSPVDGLMLLRWVRRHKESPDRFIPFVMLTGYSERGRVAEARDMGVTEFMAKPFSVDTLSAKLVQVIEKPRQFVHTATYFGPDRRRQAASFYDNDRRQLMDDSEEVEIVHG